MESEVRDSETADLAFCFEVVFTSDGSTPQWSNWAYDLYHCHPETCNALSFTVAGAFGGPRLSGELTVQAGDVVVLLASSGHYKLETSPDFLLVGAYPSDMAIGVSSKALCTAQLQKPAKA